MARHAHEFQCDGTVKGMKPVEGPVNKDSNCGWYNYPMLDEGMNGNYIIVCGHCGHEHYRTIEKGVVTDDRHNSKYGEAERIWVMPSACQKERRKRGLISQFRELVAAGRAS